MHISVLVDPHRVKSSPVSASSYKGTSSVGLRPHPHSSLITSLELLSLIVTIGLPQVNSGSRA